MKLKWIVSIVVGVIAFLLLLMFFFISLLSSVSWWLFGTTLIIYIIVGLFAGLIILAIKLNKATPIEEKFKPDNAIEIIKEKIRTDEDLCDEFVNIIPQYTNEGTQGKDLTKVVHLKGQLFWQDKDCDVIFDIKHPELATIITNGMDVDINKAILKTAESPATEEITEEFTDFDTYGRPIPRKRTIRMTKEEIQKKEEEKKAEEAEEL